MKLFNRKRLSKLEFDILEIMLKHLPNPVGISVMTIELREIGYDITTEELNDVIQKVFKKILRK